MQTRLVPDTRVLKLNVCKLGVTMLNTDAFPELKSRFLHSGLWIGEKKEGAEFDARIAEIIEEFKKYYGIDNVEIFHLSEELYPFTGVKV